ncbi:AAA family ATPase [Mycobacterium sp. B14F4]|uniref:ATP-binding protein n=1 Tax=Mycobacterium sp. B14F4 TaxID=3153565 RepID=UPI00325CAB23
MPAYIATRAREESAVAEFLESASQTPSALVIEGDAGIGKTALWHTALERARRRGFRVLSAWTSNAESVLAYSTLADLLTEADSAAVAELPAPQRVAVQRLQRGDRSGAAPTGQRAVAAASLSIIERLAEAQPVLLAIDDLQWVDPSSARVLSYTTRRLSTPVGILGTVRTEAAADDGAAWLQMRRPDAVDRITLQPLSSRDLHAVLKAHLGRPVPRTQMSRIFQISGGNPFYAIELARVADGSVDSPLPHTLAGVVQARIDGLDPEALGPLLAAASVDAPTVDLVAAAVDREHDRVIELLESAEQQGIIGIEGNRIRFAHPLLATGVYTGATADQRRDMHRRISGLLEESELRARHLALAAEAGDGTTVTALESAAAAAQARGAPTAAAELMEMAIAVGGTTGERQIRLAKHCFDSGDPQRAKAVLERAITELRPGPLRAETRYALAMVLFMDEGYVDGAHLLERGLTEDQPEPATRVSMLTAAAYALFNTGETDAAWARAEQAVVLAEKVGTPSLLSQALAVRAMLHFLRGSGLDEAGLRRSAELEDADEPAPILLRPSVLHALQSGWVGDLDEAYWRLKAIQRHCRDRGEEGELIFVMFQAALNRIWRADFGEAERICRAAADLAQQLGGEFPVMLSLVMRATLAAYCASEDDARGDVGDAIDASKRTDTSWHGDWALTALGFLETSLGHYSAALTVLEPLLTTLTAAPDNTEIFAASFVPDAVESLIALNRADEAKPLIAAVENNGQRLGRAWMLAIQGRCRAMVSASSGDLDAAVVAARQAMAHHDRLPMPFERARSQLLLGQLQRRARDRAAAATLREALATFERLGTTRWADRTRAELSDDAAPESSVLTAAESRVAELAASGMTNRDVASELFLSAKTVEAILARAYRKLGIRSRAELGQRMNNPPVGRV